MPQVIGGDVAVLRRAARQHAVKLDTFRPGAHDVYMEDRDHLSVCTVARTRRHRLSAAVQAAPAPASGNGAQLINNVECWPELLRALMLAPKMFCVQPTVDGLTYQTSGLRHSGDGGRPARLAHRRPSSIRRRIMTAAWETRGTSPTSGYTTG